VPTADLDHSLEDGHRCCMCDTLATLLIESLYRETYSYDIPGTVEKHSRHTGYCSKCFKLAYERFYKTTTIKWEIVDFDPRDKEVGELYVANLSFYIAAPIGHADSSGTIRTSIRDAWSDNRPYDTTTLHKKGGKAKR
jgi:hypothetical protein